MIQVQAKIGVTNSAVTTSHDYRIAQLEAASGLLTFITKTSNYTATANDSVILCNASGGAFTITLPTAASASGKQCYIKKIDSSGNFITVRGSGSEPIDHYSTRIIPVQNQLLHVASNGVQWYVL